MTHLHLIRHGRTFWNDAARFQGHLNSPLNDTGTTQALSVAKRFETENLSAIYTSDLGRAVATASSVGQPHGLTPMERLDLRERGMGVFEGLTRGEIERRFPNAWAGYQERQIDWRIPKGESIAQVLLRARAFLNHISQSYPSGNVLAVTHGGWIRIILKDILGIEQHASTRFRVLNTSVQSLRFVDGLWWIQSMGDVSHLADAPS